MLTTVRGRERLATEMTMHAHLRELRRRLALAVVGAVVALGLAWAFYDPIFQALQRPMLEMLGDGERLVAVNFEGIGSAFTVQLKVCVFVGLLGSAPWWVYQLWAYVRPGLLPRERVSAVAVIASAVPLFVAGALSAWYFLPASVALLTSFAPDFTVTIVNAEVYFDFVLRIVVAFGLAFLLPVVMVGLTVMGFVASGTWLRGWRYAILVAFLFAALASPSGDILTMTALGSPICALYFVAIGVCVLWERRLVRRLERGLVG